MTNRVLLGNRSTGGMGLYISKSTHNALTCDHKELLFDSSQKRTGEVYAGGNQTTLGTGGQNIYTTGSKTSLGYIPMIVHIESVKGEKEWETNLYYGPWGYTTEAAFIETTLTTITGYEMACSDLTEMDAAGDDGVGNARTMSNLKWVALKIPLGYGYMTSANFDS